MFRWSKFLMRWSAMLLAGVVLTAVGCGKRSEPVVSKNPNEQRFPLTGEILGVDSEKAVLTVKHEEIKGYMPAMTMEFDVTPGDAANAKKGQRIRAELVTEGQGDFRLEKIWVEDPSAKTKIESAANKLVQDTVSLGNKAYREIGDTVPEFTLYDQDNRVVDFSRFRGKQIMLNFIFTRCPVATMCPAAVARFQQIQRLARERGIADLELVSISLDPGYDTPGVLKTYADSRGIDTSNFHLLTGPDNAIKSLLSSFGVLVKFDGDLLDHTLATVLIDPQGRIVHRADGSKWEAEEFLQKMRKS